MTQSRAAKAAKVPVPPARQPDKKSTTTRQMLAADRAAALSDDVLASIEAAQRAAIEAVRKFVDTVDEALPTIGERRDAVIEAALDMADRLVTTQYNFLRQVVQSADRTLTKRSAARRPAKRATAKRATAKRATAKKAAVAKK